MPAAEKLAKRLGSKPKSTRSNTDKKQFPLLDKVKPQNLHSERQIKMYTGDEYLDAKYNYYPQMLTGEQLLRAVKTRFPKLPNSENMNRYELFKFYMEHIFPRPQRRGVRPEGTDQRHRIKPKKEKDSWSVPPDRPDPRLKELGIHFFYEDEVEREVDRRIRIKAALIAQARGKPCEDIDLLMEEMKSSDAPRPATSIFQQSTQPSTSISPDEPGPSVSTSYDEGGLSALASQDFEPSTSISTSTSASTSDEDPIPIPSTSRHVVLKRGPENAEKGDPEPEPPKRKRMEITWP